ncbi:hypothetical protein D3C85_1184450 [compost metagenome]
MLVQGLEFVLQIRTLEAVGFEQLGDPGFLVGFVVGAGRGHLQFELVQAVLDYRFQIGSDPPALRLDGTLDQAIDEGDAIDIRRIGQLDADISAEVVGFLRVGLEHLESLPIEAFEGLLEAAIGLAQGLEQTLVGAEELQAAVIGFQSYPNALHGLFRRQLVNTGAVQGIEVFDCCGAQHALHLVFRGGQEGVGRGDQTDQQSDQGNQPLLLPERMK